MVKFKMATEYINRAVSPKPMDLDVINVLLTDRKSTSRNPNIISRSPYDAIITSYAVCRQLNLFGLGQNTHIPISPKWMGLDVINVLLADRKSTSRNPNIISRSLYDVIMTSYSVLR